MRFLRTDYLVKVYIKVLGMKMQFQSKITPCIQRNRLRTRWAIIEDDDSKPTVHQNLVENNRIHLSNRVLNIDLIILEHYFS